MAHVSDERATARRGAARRVIFTERSARSPDEELREFLSLAREEQSQELAIMQEKYNFDFSEERPLDGSWKWERASPGREGSSDPSPARRGHRRSASAFVDTDEGGLPRDTHATSSGAVFDAQEADSTALPSDESDPVESALPDGQEYSSPRLGSSSADVVVRCDAEAAYSASSLSCENASAFASAGSRQERDHSGCESGSLSREGARSAHAPGTHALPSPVPALASAGAGAEVPLAAETRASRNRVMATSPEAGRVTRSQRSAESRGSVRKRRARDDDGLASTATADDVLLIPVVKTPPSVLSYYRGVKKHRPAQRRARVSHTKL